MTSPTGDVQLVFDTGDRILSRSELRAIATSYDDALEQLLQTGVALLERVTLGATGCVVLADADAAVHARRLLGLLDEFGPLLDPDLADETLRWRLIAAQVVDSPHRIFRLRNQPVH
jgi:hypothetical protein